MNRLLYRAGAVLKFFLVLIENNYNITIYHGFSKACGLTALLGCFALHVLQVQGFCLQFYNFLASRVLDTIKTQ